MSPIRPSAASRGTSFGAQGLVRFGLYVLGAVSAMSAARTFKKPGDRCGQTMPSLMELPPHRLPAPRGTGDAVVLRTRLRPGPHDRPRLRPAGLRPVHHRRRTVGAGRPETFVTTLGQVAAAEDPEQPTQALRAVTHPGGPHAGEPVFTAPTIAALLGYFVYALQCGPRWCSCAGRPEPGDGRRSPSPV
ncbi:hypothetical protein ACWEQO_20170 [Streptomyces sp. NPDC004051]